MTQLPNIITLLRIAGSLGLLLCDVTSVVFWIIYALCGISDIVDGWLARKLKCVTSYDLKKLPEMLAYYESKGCEVKTLAEYR